MPEFSDKGPNYSEKRNTDIEPKKDESKDKGADAAAAAGPDDAAMKEVKKWKGFLIDMIALSEVKNKIKIGF